MFDRLRWFKNVFADLPRQLRLAYCLIRDPRVPVAPKAGVIAAVGLVANPFIDLPEMIPLVGELDVLALTMLALRVFIALCPAEVVAEQERLIAEHRSRFDGDVQAGEKLALLIGHWLRLRLDRGSEAGGVDPDEQVEVKSAERARERRGAVA
jgi:uncharacterized membrane protein YkvA (DUF1232 family)